MPQAAFSWKDPTASAVCMAALVALGMAYAVLGFPTTTFIFACVMVRPVGPLRLHPRQHPPAHAREDSEIGQLVVLPPGPLQCEATLLPSRCPPG